MIKKVISTIFLAAIIAGVNLTAFAYSTDQYDIEIPDSFIQQSEPGMQDDTVTFVSSENENCGINISYQHDTLGFDFSERNLEFFYNTLMPNYGVIDATKEITTFTKNNYECFHYSLEMSVEDDYSYCEIYLMAPNNDLCYITIFSDNKEFFELESTKNMINSFTVKNYTPESDTIANIPFTTLENFNVGNLMKIYYALLGGFIAVNMLFKVIAIIIALAIVKKNNRKDASYAEESNSRQLENEQNSGGDQNLN